MQRGDIGFPIHLHLNGTRAVITHIAVRLGDNAFKVKTGMDFHIDICEAVRTGFRLHFALTDNDGVVALGDKVKALNGEVAVFSIIHSRNDYLVKALKNNITGIERKLTTVGSLHNGGINQLSILIERDKRLFGYGIVSGACCGVVRIRLTCEECSEINGHAIGISLKINDYRLTRIIIRGLDLSITFTTIDRQAPVRFGSLAIPFAVIILMSNPAIYIFLRRHILIILLCSSVIKAVTKTHTFRVLLTYARMSQGIGPLVGNFGGTDLNLTIPPGCPDILTLISFSEGDNLIGFYQIIARSSGSYGS